MTVRRPLAQRFLSSLTGVSLLCLSACNSTVPRPHGPEAYRTMPPLTGELTEYRIGTSDVISLSVLGEPELSIPTLRVDSAGKVNVPLVGTVTALGKTASELAAEIERGLSPRYLIDPQVTINVNETASQRVTVEGEVAQPGVYPITGPTTLLDVLALSRGPTRTAKLREVAIFRNMGGQQMAAKFDVRAIRRGEAANPEVRGNDIVVVGFDRLEGVWRDFLSAAPAFTVFSQPFYR